MKKKAPKPIKCDGFLGTPKGQTPEGWTKIEMKK